MVVSRSSCTTEIKETGDEDSLGDVVSESHSSVITLRMREKRKGREITRRKRVRRKKVENLINENQELMKQLQICKGHVEGIAVAVRKDAYPKIMDLQALKAVGRIWQISSLEYKEWLKTLTSYSYVKLCIFFLNIPYAKTLSKKGLWNELQDYLGGFFTAGDHGSKINRSFAKKAIGVIKDQTSISIVKVAGNVAPDLEVLIVRATGHDKEPAEEKYIRDIINHTSYSRSYVSPCVSTISKRLSKTHDWIVALKGLMLIHRLFVDGDPAFGQEIVFASRKGKRVVNMSDFRDEAHSNSWDHSGFVKNYSMFLIRSLSSLLLSKGKDEKVVSPVREMKTYKVMERLNQLLCLFDRVLSYRPNGNAMNSKMVIGALHLILKESFSVYVDMCEAMGVLLDRFPQLSMMLVSRLLMNDLGVGRSAEFPKVQKITDDILGGLERILWENKKVSNPEISNETIPNINEIKALPPPETDARGNNLALALFSAPADVETNGTWEVFSYQESRPNWSNGFKDLTLSNVHSNA
ncbi:AP180 N-terminal homology (ANTH) domain-containing protein [Artemisia annua]|uniref:AP180 N-terminal homology (ANTH) domain-containing protein n=1 Tax=Artemisia annua TaxID=35608 RepID=A0A2U1L7B1_ARTAN|nr:AP180 N-terminal homology (ANTH) domain-containing protein [Artemisia annua]